MLLRQTCALHSLTKPQSVLQKTLHVAHVLDVIHAICGSSTYSTWLEMWCFLPLACVLCLWASSTPGTHVWAAHYTKSCYLPCVWLERGLKHWLQCTASKTTLFPFKALNQVKTFERLTTMAPPAVSMRTTNSFSRKCHAASFTILLSVKEVEPFPTNTYDTDNNLKLADRWDDWFRDTLMACATCNKSRFVDLPSSLLTLATAMWCGGIDHTS